MSEVGSIPTRSRHSTVDATDEGIVTGYVGVNCLDPTDTVPRTWGSIKLIYR